MTELIPYLWQEGMNLKKEVFKWVEKTTHIVEIKNGHQKECYDFSKIEIDVNGKRKITSYDKLGNVKEVSYIYWENEFTEVYEADDGNKEIKIYDANENLISETWYYPDGTKDVKTFLYEENRLVKIVEKEDSITSIEELKYIENRLSQILSVDKKGKILMQRQMLYDEDGKIIETQRIQNKKVNKRVWYHYDKSNQLTLKTEEKINRLKGEKMPPEIYEYKYHENGVMKEEKWIIYTDESKQGIKYKAITTYNMDGLETGGIAEDFVRNFKEITTYRYKMRE